MQFAQNLSISDKNAFSVAFLVEWRLNNFLLVTADTVIIVQKRKISMLVQTIVYRLIVSIFTHFRVIYLQQLFEFFSKNEPSKYRPGFQNVEKKKNEKNTQTIKLTESKSK